MTNPFTPRRQDYRTSFSYFYEAFEAYHQTSSAKVKIWVVFSCTARLLIGLHKRHLWGENSNEVHAPVKDHVQPAKGRWNLPLWVMFVRGFLFHCREETNTIISSKSGLEPKQVFLLTTLMDKIPATNLIGELRFTANPGIHRLLYLREWWSSDFVHQMLRVLSSAMGFLDDIPSLTSDSSHL